MPSQLAGVWAAMAAGAQGDEVTLGVASGLGFYYLLLAGMNWIAALYLWRCASRVYFHLPTPFGRLAVTNVKFWLAAGAGMFVLSPLAYNHQPLSLSPETRELINRLSGPVVLTIGSLLFFAVAYVSRRWWVRKPIAWGILNLSLLAMGASMTDANFREIVAKPDNVPIVMLVYLLGFFTWLATYKAVQNDDRIRQGLEPLEKLDSEKVLVWPDLVYTELICMVVLTALLLVWGIALQAPLEEPASSVKTPNPSKAPWYFLGLQEMLVYFDPWYAGVVLPSLVIFGLMAIPYLDFNRKGSGYYTIEQRPFAYIVFQLGFLQLWVVLIILGTFLRGPNWNFFGPFEQWDAHKVIALNNVDLSQMFWQGLLGRPLPKAPAGADGLTEFGYIVWRESPGIVGLLAYFLFLPPLLATTVFRQFFIKMGFLRYMVMVNLLLLMGTLPLKMVLRWTLNLKYIIHIDEYFLNF
jgi:hypothetical protein